jgi:L-serine dehydratase
MPTTYSVFDIAGPIMVGPSSSHTAGAVKLGQLARAIFDTTPEKVTFELHGSFATVTKGHATDRALLAGIMKFKTSDSRIKDAFREAKKNHIAYEFQPTDLGPKFHPNTVRITLKKGSKKMSITGSSIGGGNVMICQVNEHDVDIRAIAGKYKSIIVSHDSSNQSLEELTAYLLKNKHHIAGVQTSRINSHAMSIVNIDKKHLTLDEVLALEQIQGIEFVRSLTKLAH